ncbi:MAG: type I methionyl aminopeptidase [Candidatus Omnitrophica bacterium]|nr:type I methionyl aminopeptidase [Candidatus Omnitrophota bacterium]
MIKIKSSEEFAMIKKSGEVLAKIMQELKNKARVGLTTGELDALAEDLVNKEGALPAFKGYQGYPATLCASVNEEVVHGLPGRRVLKDGDLLSLDLGIDYKGYFSDCALTIPIGKIEGRRKKLLEVAKRALQLGIKKARPGNHLSDISNAIQSCVEAEGFSVVRQFVGHGVGLAIHEEPEIPNFGLPHKGPLLKAGMVLAIEPMVNMGTWEVEVLSDGWTAVTKDRMPSVHFEHTVGITENGPEIFTKYG